MGFEAKYKDLLDLTLKRDKAADSDDDDGGNGDSKDDDGDEEDTVFGSCIEGIDTQFEAMLSTKNNELLTEQRAVEELKRTVSALREENNSLKNINLDESKSIASSSQYEEVLDSKKEFSSERQQVKELNATVLSLHEQAKELKNELKQKSIKIIKSEEELKRTVSVLREENSSLK